MYSRISFNVVSYLFYLISIHNIFCLLLLKQAFLFILICMKDCIIVTGYIEGKIRNIIDGDIISGSFVIAADAGYDKITDEGIRPDLIMGDFDSLKGSLPDDIEIISFPSHKDYTDTGLALKYALDHGFERVHIIGGIGGRLDHTISNIQDIAGFHSKGLDIIMEDERNLFRILGKGEYSIPRTDRKLSFFAYGSQATISIKGVEYPLDHHTLTNTYPLGVSNEFTSEYADMTVHDGTVLMLLCS